MTTTITQAFNTLKTNLEITGLQTQTVSTRQKNVREVLDSGLNVLDSFLTGSYSRKTMIAPLGDADIDMFIVLSSTDFYKYNGQNNGQAGLLDLVKRTLKKTYTKTPSISRNGQAVTIVFTDFKVDVVPSFYREGGGFLIPNSIHQSWIATNPKKHVELVSSANSLHDGKFIPLIKMIKSWNKNKGGFFQSFHLEVLALDILKDVTISDFPSGFRFFIDKAREKITNKNPDPAGYAGDVGSYINTQNKINKAVSLIQSAYESAINAEDYERRGYTRDSFIKWKEIFGNYFPSYG